MLAALLGAPGEDTFNTPVVAGPPGLTALICAAGVSQSTPALAQVDLFVNSLPADYVPADGRVVPISPSYALYALMDNAFGGSQSAGTFAFPNVPDPRRGSATASPRRGPGRRPSGRTSGRPMTATAPTHALHAALTAAIEHALGHAGVDPLLAPSRQRGVDLQANFAMRLAKRLGRKPRQIAEQVTAALGDADGLLAAVEVSGPGFLNLTLAPGPLAAWATAALDDPRLGVPIAAEPQIVVVDYSAPNVAKAMHVGHLRSTVIGDALVRALEFEGHTVIRANHLGDWGTQFGMLTQHMLDAGVEHLPDFAALGSLYREARHRFDTEPAFRDAARMRVVALQSGHTATLALWQDLVDVSLEHINAIYRRLDVTLNDGDVAGESFYNPLLAGTVTALLDAHVAVESSGAVVVASQRFTNQDGSPAVLIIRKSDGGYGYGVTDLAAIRYRVSELHAERLIYVTDARPGPALRHGVRRRDGRRLDARRAR